MYSTPFVCGRTCNVVAAWDACARGCAPGHQYASKAELLEWINGLLQLNLSRLEQFASGAVFCQLLDAYFSDAIAMSKVWHARVRACVRLSLRLLVCLTAPASACLRACMTAPAHACMHTYVCTCVGVRPAG